MPRRSAASGAQVKLSVAVRPATRRLLRAAAAKRGLTVPEYVRRAIESRLSEKPHEGRRHKPALSGLSDPVLAELWDNELDARYDRL